MKQEFAKCGGCKYTIVNVPIPDWATKIQTEVQSALVKSPETNYVIPFVDGMSQFAAAGITAAGKTGKVKISTFNGTPFALKLIQDGDVVAMDVGENLDWLGRADIDRRSGSSSGRSPCRASTRRCDSSTRATSARRERRRRTPPATAPRTRRGTRRSGV